MSAILCLQRGVGYWVWYILGLPGSFFSKSNRETIIFSMSTFVPYIFFPLSCFEDYRVGFGLSSKVISVSFFRMEGVRVILLISVSGDILGERWLSVVMILWIIYPLQGEMLRSVFSRG